MKKKIENELEFYSLTKILKECAQYNIIYGMRSNGKTFAVQELGIKNYLENGKQMAIIRRYDVDLTGKRASDTFSHFVSNEVRGNVIEELSGGKWTDIYYYSSRWYLCKYNENGERIKDATPFCYGFTLAGQEHDKSTSYPNITIILFDEFMTRGVYLPDEFITFTNVLSTIIRQRDDVKIFMCGNTVNKYNPYFKEMGLDNILKMEQGDIQVYRFAVRDKVELRVAVEYADNPNKNGKPSDVYFAFNNPRLKMITTGIWELAVYPHLPYKYDKKKDINDIYFIVWEQTVLQCEIITVDDVTFTYIHNKTTDLRDTDNDIIFTTEYNARYNYRRKITQPTDDAGKMIKWFFDHDKVFYQDNEVGEVVRNYLQWCKTDRGIL